VHFPAGSVAVKSARELCGHGDAGKGAGVEMHGGHKVDKHDEATKKKTQNASSLFGRNEHA
jgi:hypothetical protein